MTALGVLPAVVLSVPTGLRLDGRRRRLFLLRQRLWACRLWLHCSSDTRVRFSSNQDLYKANAILPFIANMSVLRIRHRLDDGSGCVACGCAVGADWTATRSTSAMAFPRACCLRLHCSLDTRVRFSLNQDLYKANAILPFIANMSFSISFCCDYARCRHRLDDGCAYLRIRPEEY
jgi:hypothetical protein